MSGHEATTRQINCREMYLKYKGINIVESDDWVAHPAMVNPSSVVVAE